MTNAVPMVAICGKGRTATECLKTAVALDYGGVVPARLVACPSGSDLDTADWQPSLTRVAEALGIPVVDLDSLRQEPDLVVLSMEYDRIIRTDAFRTDRMINVHFSDLPTYRGVYTSVWPILNGESHVGVTIHLMDPGVDTGEIIAATRFELPATATARSLFDLYHDQAIAFVHAWYPRLVASDYESRPQPSEGASSYSRKDLDMESARRLDPSWTAGRLERTVRAFYFPEYQTATLGGRGVRACYRVGEARLDVAPGTLLSETGQGALYAVGGGDVASFAWADPSPMSTGGAGG